ncbi:hypothetical protein EJ04DRAFT_445528 [Polyplosphaeria fusca]|uniref:Uncharacterized protein n=1 Tax=Polyplosphaeria fusca TaxID=682080 RepID=A0A9P4QMR2_9PLEO|nr:hypothetical protein EJ04DRAFT_445528 [Polyplosphaeria fusca]
MAPHDDDNDDRDDRPQPNPFIAFRRFADSQASSLSRTLFDTIPALFTKAENMHTAAEQCRRGDADPDQCKRLKHLEMEFFDKAPEIIEMYIKGGDHATEQQMKALFELDREADQIREQILGENRTMAPLRDERQHVELVEKVAREKGQHWGWSWSWGFPRPFDEDMANYERRPHGALKDWDATSTSDTGFDGKWEYLKRRMNEEMPRDADHFPHTRRHGFWRHSSGYRQPTRLPQEYRLHREDEPYSPWALEHNEDAKKAGVQWRDAYEDLMRVSDGAPLMPQGKIGQAAQNSYGWWAMSLGGWNFPGASISKEHPRRVPWDGTEEPSYEYGHDHEDQHDDPPTPTAKQAEWAEDTPTTELEAHNRGHLERLEKQTKETSSTTEPHPSVLSTLTTTERTMAPDGTVTTKMVLKKRFSDGREESSETVHTQRGHDADGHTSQDPWKVMQETQFPHKPTSSSPNSDQNDEPGKKKGWFWSG